MASKEMGLAEWAMLAALSVLWGGSFLFNGILVKVWPPLTIVAGRVVLAALALWLVARLWGIVVPKSRQAWQAFFGMGLINNVVPFVLIVWGQTHIASGLAAILNATTPLFGVIVAHVLTADEKLTVNRAAGLLVGFAGVVVMVGPSVLGHAGNDFLGELAVLGAALSYAFAGVYGRRFKAMGMPPLVPAVGQLTASSALLLPVALLVDRPFSLPVPGLEAWLALFALAILSSALAYILFFRILATAGATNLMLVTILIPPSAILLAAMVLGEQLAPRHFAGMVLIGAGLAAIDGRLWRRFVAR
ncbi:DMT family transporter [Rhizobiaceae bacterium BDR2-2]|uniref:DMT family transporter n=1 Tax=Ectorhizobium quercum TaxID=2965071 RepID=A0AAE3STA9_9HYPH|nr:DMT family transporter [Ectorhizobium quercum]MCX8995752.1 DMT family transporter [Ectorhizobium quercum]